MQSGVGNGMVSSYNTFWNGIVIQHQGAHNLEESGGSVEERGEWKVLRDNIIVT